MKKDLLHTLTAILLAIACNACGDDNGNDGLELVIPEVSVQNLSLKNTVLPAQKVKLRANIINKTRADIRWYANGIETSRDTTYDFSSATEGTFTVKVTASNSIGATSDSLTINVTDGFKLSDIRNWTGTGANRSALAIQWIAGNVNDLLHPADDEILFLAWGYRWNPADTPTGYDMIRAIAKKDPRLFVLVVPDENREMIIKGFGYDGNADGKIEIKSPDTPTGNGIHLTETDFRDGIREHANPLDNLDNFTVLSGGDYWIGGWHEAYTTYWLGNGDAVLEADEYEYSNFYANHRLLEDKSWDAWTFSPINSTETNTAPRPELLQAAHSH